MKKVFSLYARQDGAEMWCGNFPDMEEVKSQILTLAVGTLEDAGDHFFIVEGWEVTLADHETIV